jgi:8-oxo-dGTP pyrophosphatase MutT (NUDIX family)
MSNDLNNLLQMYKVFLNDRCLFVGTCFKTTEQKEIPCVDAVDTVLVSHMLKSFLNSSFKSDLYICVKSELEAWEFLNNEFKVIEAAGGLVLNNEGCLLIMSRLGFWDLPKGKIDKGESAAEAALREVQEECGLRHLKLGQVLEPTFHLYQSPFHQNRWILKKTHWFEMLAVGDLQLVPEVAEDIEQVEWAGAERIKEVIGGVYPSLMPLFKYYLTLKR